jgi:2-polyprenyl-6-methoxyphenol hydroxylase-like FAD-dependent oxidoreductase
MARRDFDVLVVGGGPTGLTVACELLRRGVQVRVIDQALEPLNAPKALSLWPRAHDILDDLGVFEGLEKASTRIDTFSYFSEGRRLARFRFTPDLASRTLPQPETERLLTERLTELGGKVERGVRLVALEDVDRGNDIEATDGVTAVLEYGDGVVERLRTPFVVGADGSHSVVRNQLGIEFDGSTYEMAFALVDARIEGHLPAGDIRYYQTRTGTLVIVPQPDGVFRFLSVMSGGGDVSVPMMQRIVDERGPRGVRLAEAVWQTVFRVHARHAREFRRGRVFLMGDAAHVHSPAGGQGMNNGLQDANNLGWKLAAVIRGESPPSLLDTFGGERAEATRRIVRDTDVQTRAWVVEGALRVLLRDAVFRVLDRTGAVNRWYAPVMAGRRLAYPVVRATQRPSRRRRCARVGWRIGTVFPRQLGLRYGIGGAGADPRAWTVAVAPAPRRDLAAEITRIGRRWPLVSVVRLGPGEGRAVSGCRRSGYYLVRPDGHVAAHGHAEDLGRLEAELAAVLVPGISRHL